MSTFLVRLFPLFQMDFRCIQCHSTFRDKALPKGDLEGQVWQSERELLSIRSVPVSFPSPPGYTHLLKNVIATQFDYVPTPISAFDEEGKPVSPWKLVQDYFVGEEEGAPNAEADVVPPKKAKISLEEYRTGQVCYPDAPPELKEIGQEVMEVVQDFLGSVVNGGVDGVEPMETVAVIRSLTKLVRETARETGGRPSDGQEGVFAALKSTSGQAVLLSPVAIVPQHPVPDIVPQSPKVPSSPLTADHAPTMNDVSLVSKEYNLPAVSDVVLLSGEVAQPSMGEVVLP